ncbi:MAG TPA: GNAT family N-acetyltransferase [Anaerolineae bacterium]|nr:GNAT family N-acetyltransferase [Anaerolineae bacterium]
MFCELTSDQLASVSPLFAGFDYSLSLQAAIEGLNPGRIFADDAAKPRTALALTVEGYLLAGEHNDLDILEALRQFLHDSIFSGKVYVNGDDTLSLAVHPDAWETRLPELIPTHEAEKVPRYHYLCSQVSLDWRAHLPQGYELRRVDRDLLANSDLARSKDLSEEEIEVYWGSLSHFFERGIGFCVLHGAQEVSHCTADCAAGTQIDVGIWTHPDHRRRGLAAAVVAATVEHCLAVGFRQVGWHCNVENVGSWKTAERVGFRRNREYAYYYYIYDLVDHWAELGWHHRKRGDYVRSTGYYERVFAARTENPDYYYHDAALAWAQLGDVDRALRYLNEAANRGWRHADWTRKQPGFALLQALPEFEHVLTRMA